MKNENKHYNTIHKIPKQFLPIMLLAFFSINVLGLILPLTMKKIYSSIAITRSVTSLRIILLAALLALALESIMRKAKESSSKWIAAKYEYELSLFLMEKFLNAYRHKASENNYIVDLEKFNGASKIASFYAVRYYQLFIDLPFMLLFLYLIHYFGGLLVLVPILLSFIYILVMLIVSRKYFKNREQLLSENDALMDHLTETLDKVHLVKAAGIEESLINRYRDALKKSTQTSFISNTYEALPRQISSNFSQLNLFTILLTGGFFVMEQNITFAEITACAMLGSRAISPIISIMRQYFQRKDIQILKKRIDTIAHLDNQYTEKTPNFPSDIAGSIELLDVEYTNVQTKTSEFLSTLITPGRFVHINPTDFLSYKSVLNKITGKEELHSGKVLIDNLDIELWNMTSLKGKIEFLNDHVNIYKGTILENITYFNRAKLKHGYEAAALTGLDILVGQQAEGFETKLDSYSKNHLSSAFLQRLNLTRALLFRPRILILDRIDESMDKETFDTFLWLLDKFKGSLTIIIASNHPSIIDLSDFTLRPTTIEKRG